MRIRFLDKVLLIAIVILVLCMTITIGCSGGDDETKNQDGTTSGCFSEPEVMTTDDRIEFVRTPDACFENLPDWPYEPQYVEIDGLRQAYVDVGPADAEETILLLHGQPSWSYLYRKMIPVLSDAGYRVIAMDHLGMGRSDKPIEIEYYSYLGHVDRLEKFIKDLNLEHITLFCQDWGSLIGLYVAGEHSEWFDRIVVGDGTLPVIPAGIQPFPPVENPNELNADITAPFALIPPQQIPFYDEEGNRLMPLDPAYFGDWMIYSMTAESFHPAEVVEAMTYFDISPEEEAAYDAPFPSRIYMAGPRVFPSLINDLPGITEDAWAGLTEYNKPFLTIWASNDPGNLGSQTVQDNLINNIPGATGQPHVRLPEASHFLQDDQGTEIAGRIVEFIEATKNDLNEVTVEEMSPRVGFEILEIQSPNSIRAWISSDITKEEFDALELPAGWFKNQPREGDPDASRFFRSPGAAVEGEFLEEELFGFSWWHSATVIQSNVPLDEQGLLIGSTVAKYHEVTYNAGTTISVLFSPKGDPYVRIGRDANRTSDDPTIPNSWRLVEYTTPYQLVIQLPEETLVIRTDNQDSFQGPVPELSVAR
jgi:haloalkane dehalogenase